MESGSWTDHGSTGIASSSSKAYNAIDSNLIDVDGTYYMNFGSFWHDIYQAPMNSAATKVASSSYNIAYNATGSHSEEGSYMYKYGSYYYLFFSSGTCCGYDTSMPAAGEEYKIMVCRSTSPTGGFVSEDLNFSNRYRDYDAND
jgi:arabinan endo-1,5-alpha-L-arabinosidase